MAGRHEPVVVIAVSVLALAIVLAGLVECAPPPPSLTSMCAAPSSVSPPPSSAPSKLLLPVGFEQLITSSAVVLNFSVSVPGDLQGAWEGSGLLDVQVLNVTYRSLELPGEYSLNGELNHSLFPVLFPGTYVIVVGHFPFGKSSQSPTNFTVVQPFMVVFDRALKILQPPEDTNLQAGGYSCWPISLPPGAKDVWLEGLLASTGCAFVLGVLPFPLFQQFQTNSSVIDSSGVYLIWAGGIQSCQGSSISADLPPGIPVPLGNLTAGVLVYYNSGPVGATLTVVSPIELSFLVDG